MADNMTPSTTETASPASAQQKPAIGATELSHESTANTATQEADAQDEQEDLPELGEHGGDQSDADSAFGGSEYSHGSTSISSSIRAGQWSGGRRYQVTRENAFNMPSDEKQFESMHAGHLAYTALESLRENPFFRSPISKNAQRVIDLGTGSGGWANDVADLFPNLTVHGVDLYPPPQDWVPPNCILEVDDITKQWLWPHKFDLVHIRLLIGALPRSEWKKVYRRAYDNLEPGGWIEHVEVDLEVQSMAPKPLPENAMLHTWKPTLLAAAENGGNAGDVVDWMREEIEDAGFVNLHEHTFKIPTGDWPQHRIWKEAGRLEMIHFKEGFTGWVTWGLAKFGAPSPWSPAEIEVWLAMIRKELDAGYHIYHGNKRVWAQKPYDTPAQSKQPEVVNAEGPPEASSKA